MICKWHNSFAELVAFVLKSIIRVDDQVTKLWSPCRVICQQDEAPPHYHRSVTRYLKQIFLERWIDCGGYIPWPPMSPDLTPTDYLFWEFVKCNMYI
jgi:hypothetical protein